MPRDLVKVVVTTHNRRSWAQAAIESVLSQTHRPVHVVIVDDASTDGTGELAKRYASSDPERVTAIVKPANRGVADSVATGLLAGPAAPWVAVLNDDDRWQPTKLERQLEHVESDPELRMVFCEAEIVDDHDRRTGELFSDHFGTVDAADQFGDLFTTNRACASTLLMRQEVAESVARSLPDPSVVWDYYAVLVAAGSGPVGFVEEPLAFYRVGATGLHRMERAMLRDTTRARRELFARHPDIVQRAGGPAAARRMLALVTLDAAVRELQTGSWREYLWQSGAILRQRSPRATGWLLIHTLRALPGLVRRGRRSANAQS